MDRSKTPSAQEPGKEREKARKKEPEKERERERELRTAIYAAIASGDMSVGKAVAAMRRMSKLTQPEFAKHRGLSVQSLRAIETDKGNPTVETLDKIAGIFGLQVGFVPKGTRQLSWRELDGKTPPAEPGLQVPGKDPAQ